MAEHLENGLSNRLHHSFTHQPSLDAQLKRCPSTPVPRWKLHPNPFYNACQQRRQLSRSASLPHPLSRDTAVHRPAVPARKLAASFWRLHEIPHHRHHDDSANAAKASSLDNDEGQKPLSAHYASDGSKYPSVRLSGKFRHATGLTRQAGVLAERVIHEEQNDTNSDQTTLPDDIWNHLKSMQDNQTKSTSMIASLRSELENVSRRLKEVEFSHVSAASEINGLLQRLREQMTTSRKKEQEKFTAAVLQSRQEMEEEKNSGRLLKIQIKKLRRELQEANQATATAIEELETERKARALTEDVCRELAREIGEDKAEFEELKREQEEEKEKMEVELKMLRMAALWREDRVRQKLSETQQELEGKHDALEYLKSKLEDFVKTLQKSGMGSLRHTLELLQLEEEDWSPTDQNAVSPDQNSESPNNQAGRMEENWPATDQNTWNPDLNLESPNHEAGGKGKRRPSKDTENHAGEELAYGSFNQILNEEVDLKHEEESIQEEEEEKRTRGNYGGWEEDPYSPWESDEISPKSAFSTANNLPYSKHELQASNSQYDNRRNSFVQLRRRHTAAASIHLDPSCHPIRTTPGSQQKFAKPIQSCFCSPSPLSPSSLPKRRLKVAYNLQQPCKPKYNTLQAQLLEAREMDTKKPASRELVRVSHIRRTVSS